MAEIVINGLDELFKTLVRLSDVHTVLREPMEHAVERIYQRTRYTQGAPPPPVGSRYIRTFNMLGNWQRRIRNTTDGVVGEVTNRGHPYVHWVMGDRTQARIHRGRWPTDESIASDERAEIQRLFDVTVQRVISGRR